ncbi:MAG: amidohydrolase family protein [Flavobacteriaceae bacterium]|nr:amidohydrolase family protein [Flavobacteriaceae bacterium]
MKNVFYIVLIMLLIACSSNEQSNDYDTKNYTVYMRGNIAGTQTSAFANNTYKYTFTYNDRGRGPEIEQSITLNAVGSVDAMKITGVNYLKDTISEIFKVENSKAFWESNSEIGNANLNENNFYASINGTLGDTELLIRKLLATPDHTVNLYPSGKVQIENIDNFSIGGNDLRLLEITGFGFTPNYVWIDNDDRVFASVSSWLTIIEPENNSLSEEMLAIQTEKENTFYKTLAENLTEIPTGKIVIKNVNVFDSHSGALIPNQNVVVNGNTIEAITTTEIKVPEGAKIIDGTNKTLLPGLFDNHVHASRSDGLMHLAAGVTSVRDMANSRELIEMRKEFDSNVNIGPRVVTMAGFIDQKGPFAGPGLTITNVDEGLKAIEDFAKDGYHQIKLYSSIDPSWVKPLAAKAHDLGLKLSGHIPAHMLAEDAIKDGYDEIQHVNMVVLNFLSDSIDSRTPKRFSEVAAHAYKLDLEGPEFQKFAKLLKDKGIELDATVSIFEGMFTTTSNEPDPQFSMILDRLPIQIQRGFYGVGLPIPEGQAENYKASFQKLLDIVKTLHDLGVTVIPGTDAMVGFGLHSELENYVRAGISTKDVLILATLTSAKNAWVDDELGSIEVGKLADLILVDGNPVNNISDIRRVELTIKNGNIYNPKELYQAIGIKHYK